MIFFIKKMILCAVMFYVCTDMLGNDKYVQQPYAEKVKPERGLTFKVTFDKSNVIADYAKGEMTPLKGADIGLQLRGELGFDDECAFKKENSEEVVYSVPGNIDHCNGTIIMWVKADNYDPSSIKQSTHKGYLNIKFANSDDWVELFVYHYYAYGRGYFYWANSSEHGKYKTAPFYFENIASKEWFQLAMTWDEKEINTYLNGEPQGTVNLSKEAVDALASLKPDKEKSSITLLGNLKGVIKPNQEKITVLDDISIYNYAMSAATIKAKYQQLLKNQTDKVEVSPVGIAVQGVDRGDSKLGDLEFDLDFRSLPDEFYAELEKGEIMVDYELTRLRWRAPWIPHEKNANVKNPHTSFKSFGKWQIKKEQEKRILKVDSAGDYLLDLNVRLASGKTLNVKKSFEVPELNFAANKIGNDGSIFAPWTPIKMEGHNTISVWNRKYYFQDGPFPTRIEVKDESILRKAPELIIKTTDGLAKLKYSIDKCLLTPRQALIMGSGRAKDLSLNFTTKIEYDGLVNTDFTILGSPEIESMKVAWTVAPGFADFFLSPTYTEVTKAEYEFPSEQWRCVRQLWFASARGGFCWAPANDANWVYKKGEKLLKVNREDDGAYCEVNMITQKTKMPEATPYNVLFIATPTRPAPYERYGFLMGPRDSYTSHTLISSNGVGQTAFGEYSPDEKDFPKMAKARMPNTLAIYNFATCLTESSATGRFFSRYWNFPDMPYYNMPWHHQGLNTKTRTINCCPSTTFTDFILSGIKNLFDHKYGDRVWAIYFDVSLINFCKNQLHGCSYQDKFGRWIKTNNILALRKLNERVARYCRQNGRVTVYHAQDTFNPMAHAFADYWYPGEEFGSRVKLNPFMYCDDVPDAVYRSVFNHRVLGSGVLFLPTLYDSKNREGKYTENMLAQLLLHDIPTTASFCDYKIVKDIYTILQKYDLDRSVAKFYYQQDNVVCSDPEIKATYYVCEADRYLLVLANRTKEARTITVDISRLTEGRVEIVDEYRKKKIKIENGKFEITIPARNFALLGILPTGQAVAKRMLSSQPEAAKTIQAEPAKNTETLQAEAAEQWSGRVKAEIVDGVPCLTAYRQQTIISKEFYPVETGKKYSVSGKFKSLGESQGKLFFGLVCFDKDKQRIMPEHSGVVKASATELMAAAKTGDKTITVKNNTQWKIGLFAAFNATEDYSDLPNREVYRIAKITPAGDKLQIELADPLKKDYPVNCKLRAHTLVRGAYLWCVEVGGTSVPDEWTTYGGEVSFGQPEQSSWTYLRTGTAFVSPVILVNYAAKSDEKTAFKNITIK